MTHELINYKKELSIGTICKYIFMYNIFYAGGIDEYLYIHLNRYQIYNFFNKIIEVKLTQSEIDNYIIRYKKEVLLPLNTIHYEPDNIIATYEYYKYKIGNKKITEKDIQSYIKKYNSLNIEELIKTGNTTISYILPKTRFITENNRIKHHKLKEFKIAKNTKYKTIDEYKYDELIIDLKVYDLNNSSS